MRNGASGNTNDFAYRLARFCVVGDRDEIIATGATDQAAKQFVTSVNPNLRARVPLEASPRNQTYVRGRERDFDPDGRVTRALRFFEQPLEQPSIRLRVLNNPIRTITFFGTVSIRRRERITWQLGPSSKE
jgi:hypothetical protein